ncbi:MAG: methionine biosynthesis protein MetW [Hyphomicrobiales bacterium]
MVVRVKKNMQEARRTDLELIADLIEPGTRVLDIGCGDGKLLRILESRKDVDARGIEISPEGVTKCLAEGLSVIQGNANSDLGPYPDKSFDWVILSQTVQAVDDPKHVVRELVRIGKKAIVSFPNFGHWHIRWQVGVEGRMPMSSHLPIAWYETKNIHFCTIRDFRDLLDEMNLTMEAHFALHSDGKPIARRSPWLWNLFGREAIFVISE